MALEIKTVINHISWELLYLSYTYLKNLSYILRESNNESFELEYHDGFSPETYFELYNDADKGKTI